MHLLRESQIDVLRLPVAVKEVAVECSLLNHESMKLVSSRKRLLDIGVAVNEPLESWLLAICGRASPEVEDVACREDTEREISLKLQFH